MACTDRPSAPLAGAALLVLLAGCSAKDEVRLSTELRKIIEAPQYQGARWGLHVVDMASGEVLYALKPREKFLTGSTAKIFSVTAALDAVGPGFRYETPVVHTGTITGGALEGDLVLRASGDLTLGGRTKPDGTVDVPIFDHYDANALPGLATLTPEDPLAGLDALARQVREAGVTRVKGDVLIDDRLWETVVLDQVPISPIAVNDNLLDFVLTPGAQAGSPATFDWRPKTAAYTPVVQVTTGAAGSGIAVELKADAAGRLMVTGSVPAGADPVVQTFQAPEPTAFARTLFIEALTRAGVSVDAAPLGPHPAGKLPAAAELDKAPRLATFTSPPFAEHAKLINKVSHNLGANQLPLFMASRKGKRTHEEGLELERAFARAAGVDAALVTLADGQGLPGNAVAPEGMTLFLRHLATRPDFAVFYESTPILGVDGTLASVVSPDDPARGKAHAKTGTLVAERPDGGLIMQTKALAGYIDTAKGRRLAFGIYLNDLPISKVQEVLDANNTIGKMVSIIQQAH